MKSLLTIVMTAFTLTFVNAQIVQFGIVKEMNSNGKPVAGVGISVLTATDLQPVASNSNGTFQLVFSEKKAGDIIYNIRVTKGDFEIVNNNDFKYGWKLSSHDTMKIIIASKQIVEKMRMQYYNIFYNYQEKEYKKTIEALKKALDNQSISLDEYHQKVKNIETKLQDANDRIDEYANFFARINKDDLDSLSTNALMLLEQGKLEEAIKIFEQQNLLSELKNKVSIRNQSTESISFIIPKLQEEVQYRQLVMGEENIRRIDEILRSIALSDTTNFQYLYDYALFLSSQMNMKEALKWCNKALIHSVNSEDKCNVLHIIGYTYYKLNNFEKAESYFLEAIDEGEKIKNLNYESYLITICYPLNSLANLYTEHNNYLKAEPLLQQNVKIRQELFQRDPHRVKYYAIGLNNLGELTSEIYKINNDSTFFEKALKCFDESISIRLSTNEINHIDNGISLGILYNNKGSLYLNAELYDLSLVYFQKAIQINETLFELDPMKQSENLVKNYINFGLLNSKLSNYETALEYYEKGLTICDQSNTVNPQIYLHLKGVLLVNKGVIYRKMNNSDKALDCYLKAIDAYNQTRSSCSQSLMEVYNNIGVLYFKLEKYDLAIINFQNARKQVKCLMNKAPESYEFMYARLTYEISYSYFKANDKKNGIPEYKKAKKLFQKLEKQYPEKCKSYLKDIEEESLQLKKIKKSKKEK